MSRTSTPRRSTRSQSRDPEGLISDNESIASSSAIRETATVKRKVKSSRISSRPKSRKQPIAEEELVENESNLSTTTVTPSKTSHNQSSLTNGIKISSHNHDQEGEVTFIKTPNKARKAILKGLGKSAALISFLPPFLLFAAVFLTFLLPIPEKPFRRNVYVDENALQPGSATVEWNWAEVEFADRLSDRIRSVQYKRDEDRADLITAIFQEIGLTPHKQHYTFHTPSRTISGVNAYARWSSARGDGREAFIIAVPWKSAWDGQNDPDLPIEAKEKIKVKEGSLSAYQRKNLRRTNIRGIATALTIAKFLTGYRHWSKDLIFVIADDELHGMQAFTSQYFGRHQNNLDCEELQTRGALVWNALSIDYPSDSFSRIILKHEGLNGQLPNLDVISTLTNVMYRADGLPVELVDSTEDDWDERAFGEVGDLLEKHLFQSGDGTRKYLSGLWNMFGQISRLTFGRPNGVHGLFHRYHVDAITIFASPAEGPYGFWHMGRAVESVTRSMSNLLERLHHSHFFYILTSPERFIEVTKYLPVAIMFGVALLVAGIALWVAEGRDATKRQEELIALIQESIQEEREDDLVNGFANGNSSVIEQRDIDIKLKTPTVAQRTEALVSALVQRASQKGDLIGGSKIRTMSSLLDIHGRPAGAAFGIVLLCHLIGATVLIRLTTAPIDCAQDGIEYCKPIRLISVALPITILASAVVTSRSIKASFFNRLHVSQNILPQGSIRKIYERRQFGVYSTARVASSMAMMEASVVTTVISIVNFSLAATLGGLMGFILYFTNLIIENRAGPEKEEDEKNASGRMIRNSTPASDDSEEVDLSLIAIKRPSKAFLRIRASMQATVVMLFTPFYSLLFIKFIQLLLVRSYLAERFNFGWIIDLSLVDTLLDNTLWDYQILSSTFLPIIMMTYLPVLLVAVSSCLLVALH
ncbi:hypothetical protein L7F22_043806 [Adiantum nelumboides]|nr:hypothetical protein [Adiantum nelumboides]